MTQRCHDTRAKDGFYEHSRRKRDETDGWTFDILYQLRIYSWKQALGSNRFTTKTTYPFSGLQTAGFPSVCVDFLVFSSLQFFQRKNYLEYCDGILSNTYKKTSTFHTDHKSDSDVRTTASYLSNAAQWGRKNQIIPGDRKDVWFILNHVMLGQTRIQVWRRSVTHVIGVSRESVRAVSLTGHTLHTVPASVMGIHKPVCLSWSDSAHLGQRPLILAKLSNHLLALVKPSTKFGQTVHITCTNYLLTLVKSSTYLSQIVYLP